MSTPKKIVSPWGIHSFDAQNSCLINSSSKRIKNKIITPYLRERERERIQRIIKLHWDSDLSAYKDTKLKHSLVVSLFRLQPNQSGSSEQTRKFIRLTLTSTATVK